MLGRPQVRVVLRFRPLNEEEVQKPQQQQGEESDVEETSWIKYDEDSVEIIENAPALIGGIRMPSNIPNNKNNQDYNDNNSTTPVTPTTTTTTISTTNTMMTHLDSDVEKNGMMDVLSHTTTALIRPHSRKTFTFDAVLADSTEQQETYEYIGVPVLDYVLKGYNSTILAYGQTGSGKTHSMLGPAGGKLNCFTSRSPYYESRGLIPRFAEALFNDLARFNPTERKWRVSASMFEIYMENIIDLFCTGPQATEYRIREDTLSKAVYVESLEQVECMNAMQLLELVRSGMQRRHTAATESNDTSSRSHCILSLFLEQRDLLSDGSITLSRLNFVDLAGSEKVFRTLAEGDRLREAQCINLSLALLGNVIHRLTDPKPGYVPFRDCKLTRVLQDSLGGNALTTLLCHASTAALNRDETITTLRFAQRAKRVRNRPRVNKPLIQQELGLAHASALDRIRELKQRGGMLNEVSESEQQHQQQLQSIIDSLMNEVTELKKELRTKEEELQHTSDKVEFYKHQCTLLREEHDEVCEEHKAREMKLIELCATIEQERNALLLDIEELKFNITSTNQSDWKPIAPVTPAGNSMTLQDSRKTESGTAAMTVMHPLQSIHTIFIPRIEKPQRENKTNEWHHHTDPAAPTEEEFRRSITRTPHRGETHTGEMDLRLDTLDQDINQLNDIRIVEINTTTKGMGTNPLHQEESASVQRVLQLERKLVNTSTMTDLAATDLQEQEELATAQRILQERELVNVNTMTDLAATDLQEQEEIILTQRALLRKRELEGLGVFNSRSGVVEADDVMSLPHMLEEICSSLTTVCLPDVLDAKIFESLRTVVDTLSIFNESLLNQNPMDVFESVEPQWGRAVEGGEPPEKIFPSDLLFYILRVSRDIFLPYANNISSTNSCSTKNGEEEETTIINCKEEKMVPFALKVLRDIAKGRSLGALSRFTRDEVVHAIDVVRDSFSNTVEARENDVLVLNSSGTLSDSVTVCDHTKAEVAAACNLLSTTLVQTVKVVGTEMLGLLHKRVHGGLTERELTLTCCILQDQLSSIVYTPPLHAVLLQQEVRDTIELMESVISVASTRQQQREENNEREVDNPTIDVLCSEAMKYALQTLRACISDDNSANADLLTVFYSEEVREAAVVLNRAVEAAKTQSLRNSEDTNDSNKNNNDDNNNENGNNSSKRNKRRGEAIRSKRTKDGFSTIREVHGDTQSAVIALRAYAAVLSDVYRDSETTSYLYTPNVLSAVDQLLQVLHRAVDMHITVSSGIPLLGRNNTPLLQLLQGARTNTREMLQRISLESPENQQEKEKEESEEFVDNHMSSRDRTSSPCVQAPSTAHVLNGLDCVVQKPSESSLNKKLGVTLEIEPMESIQPKEKKCEEVPLNTVDLNNPISNVRAEGSPEEGDAHTLVVTEVLSRTPSTRPRSLEPTVPVPNPTINNNYYKGEEEERGIRIRKHFADKTTSLIPFIRPLMKDVSVMTSDDKESLIFNCHVKDKQEKYDGIVQTEETAADLAIYMQFFLDTKAMLGKEKEINAAAELLAIIANMQRELEFLHNVEEPALKKELAEQECELKTIHGTLTKLQSLIQQHPCVSTSSSNEHKMPQMLREEVRDKSIPSRRRKASLRGPVLRVNYAEVPIPVSLPALGEKHSNTNTDDNTIINTTNINTNMNTAVVAEGIVEEVIMCFKTWHTLHANIVQHDAEAINRVKQLEKLLSIAKEERDTYSDKLNNLNITLSKQQTENKALRELLQTLHIDVDALNTALSQEQKAATAAAAAAAQMRQTAGQTELCEMAATELQLRSDELQSLRAELPRLRALRDAGLAGRKCELLRRGLRGLTRSVNTITALLQRESRFNTGTLETQRLLLLDSVAALTAEIAETQESLQQYIERRKIRDIVNSRMHYDDNNIPNDNNSNNNNNNNNNSTHGILVLDGERAVIASAHCGLE